MIFPLRRFLALTSVFGGLLSLTSAVHFPTNKLLTSAMVRSPDPAANVHMHAPVKSLTIVDDDKGKSIRIQTDSPYLRRGAGAAPNKDAWYRYDILGELRAVAYALTHVQALGHLLHPTDPIFARLLNLLEGFPQEEPYGGWSPHDIIGIDAALLSKTGCVQYLQHFLQNGEH